MTTLAANRKSRPAVESSYWERTHWPLQCLYFLLPLIVLYEAGVVRFTGPEDISARLWMLRTFVNLFGPATYYLPGLMVVIVLVCWHLARRDPWLPEPRLYLLMAVEALTLAAPLLVFMMVLYRQPAVPVEMPYHQPAPALMQTAELGESPAYGYEAQEPPPAIRANTRDWRAGLVLSIGAGIYEELLFRLAAIALLHMLLADVLALPRTYSAAGAVLLSSLAFAFYHFTDANPFDLGKCLFYTAAGIYFAGIYLLRGFGIVAGTHAFYDVMLVVMTQMQMQR